VRHSRSSLVCVHPFFHGTPLLSREKGPAGADCALLASPLLFVGVRACPFIFFFFFLSVVLLLPHALLRLAFWRVFAFLSFTGIGRGAPTYCLSDMSALIHCRSTALAFFYFFPRCQFLRTHARFYTASASLFPRLGVATRVFRFPVLRSVLPMVVESPPCSFRRSPANSAISTSYPLLFFFRSFW